MLNTDTIQPTTDDSNWNNFRCEEYDRINPKTAQGEQSNMMQAENGPRVMELGQQYLLTMKM